MPHKVLYVLHQGLEAIRATETQGNLTYFLTLLAEAYARHAQAREGLAVVDDALRLVHNIGNAAMKQNSTVSRAYCG